MFLLKVSLNVPSNLFPVCVSDTVIVLPSSGSGPCHIPLNGRTLLGVGWTGVLVGTGKTRSAILGEATTIVMQPPTAVMRAASPVNIPGTVPQNDCCALIVVDSFCSSLMLAFGYIIKLSYSSN